MNLIIKSLNLKLKYPFRISRETKTIQNNILVILEDEDGIYGIGEAAPVKYYGEYVKSVRAALRRMSKFLINDPFHIEDITNGLQSRFPADASARASVDIALHDLVAKKLNIPLYKFLGLNPSASGGSKVTSFTIGLDSIDMMCKKIEEAKDFPILKIKLGVKNDLKLLEAIGRKIRMRRTTIRIDANAGWTVKEAIKKINAMKDFGVEFVEQPIPPGNIDGLKKVRDNVDLPIIVDEDVKTSKDIISLAGAVDGINIKLMKCGGIREALRMINIARAHKLKIMLGCMIESSISITAAAHLTPLVDYADLDGNILITNDPFTGVTVERGKLLLSEREGLGIM
ncbi:MAG TPA: dipeptide epimerase [Candidatus Brocadiia bacterium]|nr:dipeptide epimerase [Planctomycetota bacterium]